MQSIFSNALSIMVPNASIPAVRQNRSKLTETASQALPTAPIPVGGEAINVVLTFFMALLSFVDSTPRAYRLKASNAAPPISTFPGAIPVFPVELRILINDVCRRIIAERFVQPNFFKFAEQRI